MEIGEIFCAWRSSENEGMLRARISIFSFMLNEFMRISTR